MTDKSTSPARIIQALGGNAKTAKLCEVTRSAVSQWVKNGIPRAQLKYLQAVRPEAFADALSTHCRTTDIAAARERAPRGPDRRVTADDQPAQALGQDAGGARHG